MKKNYEKPALDVIDFKLNDNIMEGEMPDISESLGDINDGWN